MAALPVNVQLVSTAWQAKAKRLPHCFALEAHYTLDR